MNSGKNRPIPSSRSPFSQLISISSLSFLLLTLFLLHAMSLAASAKEGADGPSILGSGCAAKGYSSTPWADVKVGWGWVGSGEGERRARAMMRRRVEGERRKEEEEEGRKRGG